MRLQGRRDHDPDRRLHRAGIRESWKFTNQSNAFHCNLMVTANVCMCGQTATFDSMGEGMIVQFRRQRIVAHGITGRAERDHHRRGTARPGARGAHHLGRGEQHLPVRPPRLRRCYRRREGLPLHLHAGYDRRPIGYGKIRSRSPMHRAGFRHRRGCVCRRQGREGGGVR